MSHSFRQEPELTHEQATQALRRAIELQAESESSPKTSEGVDTEQLALMAAELGVKPEYVRQAGNELLGISLKAGAWTFDPKGGFDHLTERPLREEDWVQLGIKIQPIMFNLGTWDEEKQSARWSGPHLMRLTLTPAGQRTRAKLVIDPSLEIGLGCGLAVAGFFLVIGVLGSIGDHDVASMVTVTTMFLVYLVVAGWFKLRANWARKRHVRQLSLALAEYFGNSEP